MCLCACMWKPEVESHIFVYCSPFYLNFIIIHNLRILNNVFLSYTPCILSPPWSISPTQLCVPLHIKTNLCHPFTLGCMAFFPRLRGHWGRVDRKSLRARGSRRIQGNVSSVHNRAAAHMNSQPLRQHAQALYKLKPHKIPTWTTEMGMKSFPNLRSYRQMIAAGRGRVSCL